MNKKQMAQNKERVLSGLKQLTEMAEKDEITFFCGVFACPDGQTGKFIHGGNCTVPHIIGEMAVIDNMLMTSFINAVYPEIFDSKQNEPIVMETKNARNTDH